MAIDNDYTSSGFNSYFESVEALNQYVAALDGLWNISTWTKLNTTQRQNIMFGATSDLNSFCYTGSLNGSVNSAFNMRFPRSGMTYQNGVSIPSNEIPEFVKDYIAQRVLEKSANVETGKFYNGRIKKQKLGKLEQEFQNPRDSIIIKNTKSSAKSYVIISPYVTGLTGNFRYVLRA